MPQIYIVIEMISHDKRLCNYVVYYYIAVTIPKHTHTHTHIHTNFCITQAMQINQYLNTYDVI